MSPLLIREVEPLPVFLEGMNQHLKGFKRCPRLAQQFPGRGPLGISLEVPVKWRDMMPKPVKRCAHQGPCLVAKTRSASATLFPLSHFSVRLTS